MPKAQARLAAWLDAELAALHRPMLRSTNGYEVHALIDPALGARHDVMDVDERRMMQRGKRQRR
jgi:hypothetical protein